MIGTVFKAIPAILGVVMLAAAVWEYMLWHNRFGTWRRGVGTSSGAVKRVGDVGPRLSFDYVVDGVSHSGLSSHMRDSLPEKGRRIAVYFDPADPSKSDWYDTGMHLFYVYAIAALGALLVWKALF